MAESQIFDLVLLGLAEMLAAAFVVFPSVGNPFVAAPRTVLPLSAPVVVLRRLVIEGSEHFDAAAQSPQARTCIPLKALVNTIDPAVRWAES